jgi:hypothetical protein
MSEEDKRKKKIVDSGLFPEEHIDKIDSEYSSYLKELEDDAKASEQKFLNVAQEMPFEDVKTILLFS